jgi:group II intron reverse transcriptase/maturase
MTMVPYNGTNRKPKELEFQRRSLGFGLKGTRGTMGSTDVHRGEGASTKPMHNHMTVDGGPVVPEARVMPTTERGPGKPRKSTANASVDEATSQEVSTLVICWSNQEKDYRGVIVPRKFAKITKYARNKESTFDHLYQLMLDPAMYDHAYHAVKSNPGMMSPGVTPETLNSWSAEAVDRIIEKLRNESFQFTTARTKVIPKPSGGKRVLKIASPRDKVVQKVMALILQEIYEPIFSDWSFGFRENRGPHDALRSIERRYTGARWFIEGDIEQRFDSIDHHRLVQLLRKKVKDERFIILIWKALRAGALDEHRVPKDCIIGTPQGSILIPVLSNIMLHEFDAYMTQVLIPKHNRGIRRRVNPIYHRTMESSRRHAARYTMAHHPEDLTLAKAERKLAQSLPSTDPFDLDFRRLTYVRYADDWLIGFVGPRCEARQIKDDCRDRLLDLGLILHNHKTKITRASEGCAYLGARIHVPRNQERFKAGSRLKAKAVLGVRLNAPIKEIIGKFANAGYCDRNGRSKPRFSLYAYSKDEIVATYDKALSSYLNYYGYADNRKPMASAMWTIMRNSCAKLLAAKFKLRSVRQVLRRYGRRLGGNGPGLMDIRQPIKAFRVAFKLGKRRKRAHPCTKERAKRFGTAT